MAQVAGAGTGQALEFDCITARKHLNTLQAMYAFAAQQKMIKLEPKLVARIEKLVSKIDAEQQFSQTELKRKTEEELKPWLNKYRLWKEMSEE